MANALQVNENTITLKALSIFKNKLRCLSIFDKSHSKDFGQKGNQRGDSRRIRKPDGGGTVRRDTWTFASSDIEEQFDTLTVDKIYGSDFTLQPKELALELNDLSEQVLKPRIHRLAAEIDKDVFTACALAAHHTIGKPGTKAVTSGEYLEDWMELGAKLGDYDTPYGEGMRHALISPTIQARLSSQLREDFNSQATISRQNKTAMIEGFRYGFNWGYTQQVPTLTTGSRAATGTLVDGADQKGASITVDALGAGKTAKKGEAVTFAGCHAVNPVTKAKYPWLKQFRLTADVAANATSLPIEPAIVTTGGHKNVSAGPADDAAVTFIGDPSKEGSMQLAAHPSVCTVAFVPLDNHELGGAGVKLSMKTDPDTGIGMSFLCWTDGSNRQVKCRFDVLAGILVQRPEFAGVVFSE